MGLYTLPFHSAFSSTKIFIFRFKNLVQNKPDVDVIKRALRTSNTLSLSTTYSNFLPSFLSVSHPLFFSCFLSLAVEIPSICETKLLTLLTSLSRIVFEKLTVAQLVKKFPLCQINSKEKKITRTENNQYLSRLLFNKVISPFRYGLTKIMSVNEISRFIYTLMKI
jgi:hypothetical protein